MKLPDGLGQVLYGVANQALVRNGALPQLDDKMLTGLKAESMTQGDR